MYLIALDSETDFDGWRKAARALVLHQVAPADVTWGVQGQMERIPSGLSEAPSLPPIEIENTFSVPANFIELARTAILHRDGERFALLYRLLWRLRSDHDLLETRTDPDVALAAAMSSSVHRDVQRMLDVIRFREIGREHKAHYAAWFVPELTSSNLPPRSSPAAMPTCPGRFSRPTFAPIGMATRSRSRRGSARRRRPHQTGWRKPGAVTSDLTNRSHRKLRASVAGTCRKPRYLNPCSLTPNAGPADGSPRGRRLP